MRGKPMASVTYFYTIIRAPTLLSEEDIAFSLCLSVCLSVCLSLRAKTKKKMLVGNYCNLV